MTNGVNGAPCGARPGAAAVAAKVDAVFEILTAPMDNGQTLQCGGAMAGPLSGQRDRDGEEKRP